MNEERYPGRGPPGELIALRGLRRGDLKRCPGVQPSHPGLILEVMPLDAPDG